MRYKKWVNSIIILSIVSAICNANAKNIDCSLNTNCVFSSYDDWIYVPTDEKTDYKCHVVQRNNISAHGSKPVINTVVGGDAQYHSDQKIELGGENGNDGNMYFAARMVTEKGKLLFFVTEKSLYYVDKIADISINCIKI